MQRTVRAGAFLIAAVVAAAIGPAGAETIAVAIDNVAYVPATITARVGDVIEWTNKDIVAHTATNRDKSWDLMIFPNKAAKLTLKRAGEIDYYCKFHPNMKGHISIKQ
jgi:plastocyanin